jgi:hypothetical protein
MEGIYSDIGSFEKRLKHTGPIGGAFNDDSSDEERPMDEMERLNDKNRVLIEKLYICQNQVKDYKQIIDTLENSSNIDNKDK